MGVKRNFLILDANVLIDFLNSDKSVIKLICTYVGQIFLATPVLDEIDALCENDCLELGIKLIEPEVEHLLLASAPNGPLSFQDNLCLILAKEHGFTCVSNDRPLRQQCENEGVPLVWGIELLCILAESGGLSTRDAKEVILKIHEDNPKYITTSIVKIAFKRLGV